MYVGFIETNDYIKGYYGFHKLQSALLFMAFSMIIRDWSKVLYEIQDLGKTPFLLGRVSLIIINVCYMGVSIFSCIYLWIAKDIDSFVNSPLYVAVIFAEVAVALLLASMMLHSGLQLSSRIHGVVDYTNDASEKSQAIEAGVYWSCILHLLIDS